MVRQWEEAGSVGISRDGGCLTVSKIGSGRDARRWAARVRDSVYALRLDDDLVVKRVQRLGGGRLRLVSEHPAYPPIEVGAGEAEVLGRVVWSGVRVR
ncbi:MAG: S24 family peptidase [Zetaproteobacteria bacterium]|nr:MAG: S24 family peptidase [Zetaproteobacteria bacterium]